MLAGARKKVLLRGQSSDASSSLARFSVWIDGSSCERMIVGDVEEMDFASTFAGELFDVVVFGEVLEHLVDPHRALVEAAKVLRGGGYVVASVPNVAHGSVRLALLDGAFPYTERGLLDYTHLRFFTRKTLADLFRQAGYSIRVWRYVLVDPFAAELNVREQYYPHRLIASLRQDREAMTYQFVIKAYPLGPGRAAREWAPFGRLRLRPRGEPIRAILRLEDELRARWAAAAHQAAVIEEQKALQVAREEALARQAALLATRETALQRAETELAAIRESWGYRLLEAYRQRIRWLFPAGSLRAQPYRALVRAARWLLDRRGHSSVPPSGHA